MFECEEDLKKYISEHIGKLRTAKKVSARDMSLTLGQGESYINNIENGQGLPSIKMLFYICEYFNISVSDFFNENVEYPEMVSELMNESMKLDEKSLKNILDIVKSIKK